MDIFRSLKFKIWIPVMGIIGLVFWIIIYSGFSQMKSTVLDQEKNRHVLIQTQIQNDMEAIFEKTGLGLSAVASNPEIQKAFYERDREKLTELTLPVWEQIKDRGMEQFQFHVPPAVSFLRLHNLSNYGDDLSSFRATVVQAIKNKETITGLEEGRAGIGFRVVTPVFYRGELVGSVEYGMGFGDHLLQKWKENIGGEFYLYCTNNNGVAWDSEKNSGCLARTSSDDGYPIPEDVINRIMETGHPDVVFLDGESKAAVLVPVQDYQGRIIGYVKNIIDRTDILNRLQGTMWMVVSIFVGSVVVLTITIFFVISRLLAPLSVLENRISRAGRGDLALDFDIRTKDEIGRLAGSFKSMLQNIKNFAGRTLSVAQKLNNTESSLHVYIAQANSSMQEATAAAGELAASSGQVNENVSLVSEQASHVVQTASGGNEVSRKAAGEIKSIHARINSLGDMARELDNESEQISNIVDLINNIAEQTNLLALNASIEAARAGEQGRGFAVVAGEVGKLAGQTTEAAGKVTARIADIRSKVQAVVVAVQASVDEMNQATELVTETQQSFTRISQAVNSIAERIKSAMDGTQQISYSSQQVAAVMQEQSSMFQEISAVSETLNSFAGELEECLTWFNITDEGNDRAKDSTN